MEGERRPAVAVNVDNCTRKKSLSISSLLSALDNEHPIAPPVSSVSSSEHIQPSFPTLSVPPHLDGDMCRRPCSSCDSFYNHPTSPDFLPPRKCNDHHYVSPAWNAPPSISVLTSDAYRKPTDTIRRICFNCCSTDTPAWRRSILIPGKIVCNKCGLYERIHSYHRPVQDVDRATFLNPHLRTTMETTSTMQSLTSTSGADPSRYRSFTAHDETTGVENAQRMYHPYPKFRGMPRFQQYKGGATPTSYVPSHYVPSHK